jgi:hypothetical protein
MVDSWTERQMDGGMDIPVRFQVDIQMAAKLYISDGFLDG